MREYLLEYYMHLPFKYMVAFFIDTNIFMSHCVIDMTSKDRLKNNKGYECIACLQNNFLIITIDLVTYLLT